MPLPIVLGIGAAIAAAGGFAAGANGAIKMKDAKDTIEDAEYRHRKNLEMFEDKNKSTTEFMDYLGKKELKILSSFERFSQVFEKIQNKPKFSTYEKNGVKIPKYSAKELKEVSIGAGILLGGLGGAALGTAGGFAAAGATTAAVMALGTASTGTAIATLSGAAATNATLAALGGGAIAAGGGGIALGTTILGAATLGVALLVGGIIFNFAGSSLSEKADEAWDQMIKAENEIKKICDYIDKLKSTAKKFDASVTRVNKIYERNLNMLINIVEKNHKTDWETFTNEEKLITENTVLLVNLLFNMGKIELVLKNENKSGLNKINITGVTQITLDAKDFIIQRGLDYV